MLTNASEPARLVGIRRPEHWFEVRADGPDAVLLGWVSGIASRAVEGDCLQLYAAPEIEDLEYVEDTEHGARVRVSEMSELKSYRVREREHSFDRHTLCDRPYDLVTPSYAERVTDIVRNTVTYHWRHLSVSAEEAQELFDYPAFEPYEPEPDTSLARRLAEENGQTLTFIPTTMLTGSAIRAGAISASKLAPDPDLAAAIAKLGAASAMSATSVNAFSAALRGVSAKLGGWL